MYLYVVFLVIAAMVFPGEMKSVEELEKELNFLKMSVASRFENIETKTVNIEAETENIKQKNEKTRNVTEERLSYLEEMAKLNVIRTCDDMSQLGVTASNFYFIDPDGPLIGSEPFRVWCEFTEDGRGTTEVMHNSEDKIEVGKCEEPGCYVHPVVYLAPEDQIQSLIQLSHTCEQSVRYDCLLAPLMNSEINIGFWLDNNGQSQVYWDGAHQGQHVCSCFFQEEGCLEQNIKNTTCNCDAGVSEMMTDLGRITNKTALPITSLQFGGLVYDIQQAFHSLGRLRCWGKATYEEGTSCTAIKKSGQFFNGFYNVKKNEMENTQLVFCNLTSSPGYEEDGKNQIFIESSEDHFDKIEESIAIVDEDIAKINNDIAANDEDIAKISNEITANAGRITKLEDDVKSLEMRTSFCGYRYIWNIDNSMITYDKLLVEDNNIPGSSFKIATGLFTAGVAGLYKVDLGIGLMWSSSSEYSLIYISLNGLNIEESIIHSHIYGTSASWESAGRTFLLYMEKNDDLGVYVERIYDLHYITFCVSLDTVST